MPSELIHVNALICEKTLQEGDFILSAIRIADMFRARIDHSVPPESRAPIVFFLITSARFIGTPESHRVTVDVVRVSGEVAPLQGEVLVPAPHNIEYPDAPHGFNLVSQCVIVPANLGTAYLSVSIDGKNVARVPFTIADIADAQQEHP